MGGVMGEKTESKLAYVFPGQGSQAKGMGGDLFDQYKELTAKADAVLGYSIKQLCLDDPLNQLSNTQYTQPAVYTVSALSYYRAVENSGKKPDYVAGHSLGEYNALLASAVFDFETGLKLVQYRGLLMSTVSGGAMAAIVGLTSEEVRNVLLKGKFDQIEIANFNAPTQTVISGNKSDIFKVESSLTKTNGHFIPLNTSGAFHSHYMESIKQEFISYLREFEYSELQIPVISNVTARPYIQTEIVKTLAAQITNPVKWTDSIQYLLNEKKMAFTEIGTGTVLSRLIDQIKKKTITPVIDQLQSENAKKQLKFSVSIETGDCDEKNIVFMYGGQGFHYFQMGKELYENNTIFRNSMDNCNEIVDSLLNRSMVDEMYLGNHKTEKFDDVLITHTAIFSVQYSLTQVLLDHGCRPDAVLGYSMGEYVAATVGGMLSLEDGLRVTAGQAKLLHDNNDKGAMLVVLSAFDDFSRNHDFYDNSMLAGINYENNFVLSGRKSDLITLQLRLQKLGVLSEMLAVNHAFHSELMNPIKDKFELVLAQVKKNVPKLPIYSSVEGRLSFNTDSKSFWESIRKKTNFKQTITEIQHRKNSLYVDLSPTGSLSNFIKYGFKNPIPAYCAINRFCQNNKSIDTLLTQLGEKKLTSNATVES